MLLFSTRAAALAALAVLCATPARAQEEPLVTDRPDFTESTSTVAPRRVQAEAGYTFQREGSTDSHTLGELLLRIGLHPRAELRVGLSSYDIIDAPEGTTTGLEDASLGAKLALLRRGQATPALVPEVSVIVATSLPTGADALSSGGFDPEAKLALGWDVGDRAGVAANLNYTSISGGTGRQGELAGSVSLGMSLVERLDAFTEYYAFFPTSGAEENAHHVNGGVTFQLTPNFQLDARLGRRLTAGEATFFGVGLARRW